MKKRLNIVVLSGAGIRQVAMSMFTVSPSFYLRPRYRILQIICALNSVNISECMRLSIWKWPNRGMPRSANSLFD